MVVVVVLGPALAGSMARGALVQTRPAAVQPLTLVVVVVVVPTILLAARRAADTSPSDGQADMAIFREQILDGDGNPVVGADARVSNVGNWSAWWSAETDAMGGYDIEIPAGRAGSTCDVRVFVKDAEREELRHQITLISVDPVEPVNA